MDEVKKFPVFFFERKNLMNFLEDFFTVINEPLDEVINVPNLGNGALRWRFVRYPTESWAENDSELGRAHFIRIFVR